MSGPEDHAPEGLAATVAWARGVMEQFGLLLAGAAALLLAWPKLKAAAETNVRDWSAIDRALFAALALLLAVGFFTSVLPRMLAARRKRRIVKRKPEPLKFRLWPYEDTPEDRRDFDRTDGVHREVLEWVGRAEEPVLVLTGVSGTGKSSLLQAYVLPELRDRGVRTVLVRSFEDPVGELVAKLTAPGTVWKNPPRSVADASAFEVLRDACAHLAESAERLLVVFDQSEELLILHDDEAGPATAVRDLIKSVTADCPAGLTVLFALRSRYKPLLYRLGVPLLTQRRNWVPVTAFTVSDAKKLLGSQLELDADQLSDVVREAIKVERTKGLIRPVTLNILGLVLGRAAGSAALGAKPGRMLATWIEHLVFDSDVRDTAPAVLARMLTDEGTKHPRKARELTWPTGPSPDDVENCLQGLHCEGVVRPLNTPPNRSERVWEISHDFVAQLIQDALRARRVGFLSRVRAVAVPLSLILAGAALAVSLSARPRERSDLMAFLQTASSFTADDVHRLASIDVDGAGGASSRPLPDVYVWLRSERGRKLSTALLGNLYAGLERGGFPPDRESFFRAGARWPADGFPEIRFVPIPQGIYSMGSSESEQGRYLDESPIHRVSVPSFELAATEVTNAQYKAFDPDHTFEEGRELHPAANLSWGEAYLYCRWLGARLPSEAEWEYACRAGATTRYWLGDDEADLARVGWYEENSEGGTHPVGEKPANPWGLHDMHGNVFEWCEDTWHTSYKGAPDDGTAWVGQASESCVVRGGSWNRPARSARSAFRLRIAPGDRWYFIGFRPARSVTAD